MMKRLIAGLFGLLFAAEVSAQSFTGTVQNHAIPIGKGPGVSGMTSLLPGSTNTLLRSNGPSADPSYASVAVVLDTICTARGSLLFRNATVWTCLPPGTNGQPLLTQGAGADPIYGTVTVPFGGTGLTSGSAGGVLAFSTPTTLVSSSALTSNALVLGGGAGSPPGTPVSLGTTTLVLHGNAAGPPTWGTVDMANSVSGVLASANGGTDTGTVTQGDLLYGSTTTGWSRLSKSATATRYLSNQGASNGPAWSQVNLPDGVTGVLPEANGGTNQSTYAQGDLLYASAANVLSKLAKNTTATRYLSNTGASNAPQWDQITLTTGASDYAEGSWTPVIAGSTTAGTQTYTVQVGRYVRIGNNVTVHGRVTTSAIGGTIAGNVLITGLPFTARNVTNLLPACSLGNVNNVTLTGGYFFWTAIVGPSTTSIAIVENRSANTAQSIPVAALGAATDIIITCNYLIN